MKMRPRIYYTETDKALMWDRCQKMNPQHKAAILILKLRASVGPEADPQT